MGRTTLSQPTLAVHSPSGASFLWGRRYLKSLSCGNHCEEEIPRPNAVAQASFNKGNAVTQRSPLSIPPRCRLLWALCVAIAIYCKPPRSLAAESTNFDESIRQFRTGTLVIEAAPGDEVHVEQLGHAFWFGAALASQMFRSGPDGEEVSRYKRVFLENFNAAVTENALKWHSMEPRKGEVDYDIVGRMLAWSRQHRIPLRGHNVFWGTPSRVQPWLKTMDNETLRETLKARAIDVARRYQGEFAEYDLNNEMLHGNYYE